MTLWFDSYCLWMAIIFTISSTVFTFDCSRYPESILVLAGCSVAPGTVVKAHKGDLIVKTGDGFIKIFELQAEGGKRLKAQDCAHNYKIGMRFGE